MNLPNKLTVLRIVLVPIVCTAWLFPYEQFGIEIGYITFMGISVSYINLIVLALFCIASFTDFLDGQIARRKNLVTTFGKFADPIADKLLVNMMLILLAYERMLPVVPVILMILRDIIVDGCRMIASQRGVVVSAGILGKMKTVLQMITIIVVLINNLPFELWQIPMSDILIWFTSFISIAGGYSYFMQVRSFIFESM